MDKIETTWTSRRSFGLLSPFSHPREGFLCQRELRLPQSRHCSHTPVPPPAPVPRSSLDAVVPGLAEDPSRSRVPPGAQVLFINAAQELSVTPRSVHRALVKRRSSLVCW